MFSKHPNGLIAAALANMGERFGFYIMMAILTLFISAKFGLSETTTGYIYSAFYASIYILALAGGIIADKTKILRHYFGRFSDDGCRLSYYCHSHSHTCSQHGTLSRTDLLWTFGHCVR